MRDCVLVIQLSCGLLILALVTFTAPAGLDCRGGDAAFVFLCAILVVDFWEFSRSSLGVSHRSRILIEFRCENVWSLGLVVLAFRPSIALCLLWKRTMQD